MQKKWVYALPLILLVLFCTVRCRTASVPARVLAFNAFYKSYDSGDIGFYIDWRNNSRDKTIDSIVLSISGGIDGEEPLKYHIMEPSGVMPGTRNHISLHTIPQYSLPDGKITSLSVSVIKTRFTDGSIWKKEQDSPDITAKIDGKKGYGIFPVRLNEALAYTPSTSFMRFQADWTNLSETDSIIGIVYKITAKSPYGTPVTDLNGNDTVYLTDDYADSEWIQPGSDNNVVEQYTWYEDHSGSIYEISVCKVIGENGAVWINPDENDRILTIVNSKKGYHFSDHSSNTSVQSLVGRISEESSKCGLHMDSPEIFIKDQNYCILRYDGVDIRVELSENNEVLPVKVEFIFYSKIPFTDETNIPKSVSDKMKALRICVCASVLTDLPYEETIQRVKEYNNNEESGIDFSDPSYETIDYIYQHTDKYFSKIYFGIFAAGLELGLPFVDLFWVRSTLPEER